MSVEYKPISESEFAFNIKLSHRVRRFDLADIEVKQIDNAGQEVAMNIEVGEQDKKVEAISMEWLVKVTTPEGVDASSLSKKVILSIKPPKKEGYDVNLCFQSLEGVKLLQPVQLSIDQETLKFEAQEL